MSNHITIYTLSKSQELIDSRFDVTNFAPEWDSGVTYPNGSCVSYDGAVYAAVKRSVPAGSTPSSSSEYWKTASTVGYGRNPLSNLALSALNWNPITNYSVGDVVFRDGTIYRCLENGTVGEWNASKWDTKYFPMSGGSIDGSLSAYAGAFAADGSDILLYGTDDDGDAVKVMCSENGGITFVTNGMSSTLECDGGRVATLDMVVPNNIQTYSESEAYSSHSWVWYDGDATNHSGPYVCKENSAAGAFNPQTWEYMGELSAMLSYRNRGLVDNIRGRQNADDIYIATIGGSAVYAPVMDRSLVVTAVTSSASEVVTGETVTLWKFNPDEPEESTERRIELSSRAYNGQPVSFTVSGGLTYWVQISNNEHSEYSQSPYVTGTIRTNEYVTLKYGNTITTLTDFASALQFYTKSTSAAAESRLVGLELPDTWTSDDGIVYNDPLICTAVKIYQDKDGTDFLGAKLERKYAMLNCVEMDMPNREKATEPTAQDGIAYVGYTSSNSEFTELTGLAVGGTIPYGQYDDVYKVKKCDNGSVREDGELTPHEYFVKFGHMQYAYGVLRQYLNSSLPTTGWWTQQLTGQLGPSARTAKLRGYMAGCSTVLKPLIKQVLVPWYDAYAYGGEIKYSTESFFIDSTTEVYADDSSLRVHEGTLDAYWKSATSFDSPNSKKSVGRIKYCIDNRTTAAQCWTRTTDSFGRSYFFVPFGICRDGSVYFFEYGTGIGTYFLPNATYVRACPCCVIFGSYS